jgi:glycosidase
MMSSYPASVLPPLWWEAAAAIARPYLKSRGFRLQDVAASLDDYQRRGIDTLEIFAPCRGGVCYNGLDTLDFYQIDPAIGTMEDFKYLVSEAHSRKMAIILFLNLGYAHEQFPAFLRACDDVRLGIDSPETRMFLWSETGQDKMDRSRAPYFMNDSHGNWRWSERAGKYFWVMWEGEKGGYHLPQFNFGDPGWQAEVQRIIRYWLASGVDGMVIDAVNWYIDCTWEICRFSMTDAIREADNQFCQPEGAGGFRDDPLPWVEQGGWNCIMDYSIKLWWEGVDVIRDALRSGDPRPVEAALRRYRDRVVGAGGVCYIDPPSLADLPRAAQILGAALTASMGELVLLLGDLSLPAVPDSLEELGSEAEQAYRGELDRLLRLRRSHPALCAGGERRQVETSDDARCYAFQRHSAGENLLAVFNFQSTPEVVSINLNGLSLAALEDLFTGEQLEPAGKSLSLHLPAYGFRFFSIRGSEGAQA